MRFEKISKEEYLKSESEGYENIHLPLRATKGSAGYDIATPVDVEIKAHSRTKLKPTGLRCQIDEGYVMLLFVRSSIGIKKGLTLCNGTGVIDSDYYYADNEGHIMFALQNNTDKDVILKAGDKVMQAVIVPFSITEDDNANAKRKGGFGSTS